MDLEIYDETHQISPDEIAFVRKLEDFAGDYLHLAKDTEMSITFVDDERIREINRDYRNTDRVTDVISFAIEEDNGEGLPTDFEAQLGIPKNIGDLFIDPYKIAEQARTYGHSYERELGYTCVHGFLHLNGYDHIKPEDEQVMIPLQEKILDAYGLTR